MADAGENPTHPSMDPSLGFRMVINGIKARFNTVHNMSTTRLEELCQQESDGDADRHEKRSLVIVDVRPEEEYNISHIPSAVRIDWETEDMGEIKKTIQDQGGVGALDVVMYCSVGYRSSSLAQRLTQAMQGKDAEGASQSSKADMKLYNLEGSLFKWANEGRDMVDSSAQPTNFVHPYSTVWGRLVSKDIRKWPESKPL